MNRRKFLALGAGVMVAAAVPAAAFKGACSELQWRGTGGFTAIPGHLVCGNWEGLIAWAPLDGSYWWVRQGSEWVKMGTPKIEWPYGKGIGFERE